jgi:hypothetical protein
MPFSKYIRFCNPDFNINYPVNKPMMSGSVVIDNLLLKMVHDPACGLVSMGSCQPLFYSEDLEYLSISAGEMVLRVTDENIPLIIGPS